MSLFPSGAPSGGSVLPGPQPIVALIRRPPLRAIALVVAVVVAYHYSLLTLLRGLTLQTPLAYLALVPIIALLLGWIRMVGEPAPLPIHDRQVDYIVGVGFIAAAVTISVVFPSTLSTTFWLNRYDLLSLPLLVAGLVAVLYGLRRLWALKVSIAFLLLAWPVPYGPLIGDGMRAFADLSAAFVAKLAEIAPVATPAPGDDSLFFVGHGTRAFAVSIGSACSGVNGLVGFLLIGAALAYAVRGDARRRAAWLIVGLATIWLLNVARIEAILVVGALFGEAAALDILHPVAGLIVFNVGVLAMLLSARRFGLSFVGIATQRPDGALTRPVPVRRPLASLAVCTAVALSLAAVNAGYARFEAISGDLGEARLAAFDIRTAQVPGWKVAYVGSFEQAHEFFGSSSSWERIAYASTSSADLRSSVPLYVDVINTSDSGALAAYGLEACYRFHGYQIESITSADIGAGVNAQVIDYHNTKIQNDWSALWWEWPYASGGTTSYERIVIFVSNAPLAQYVGGATDIAAPAQPRFDASDRFLVALARSMVQRQLSRVATR